MSRLRIYGAIFVIVLSIVSIVVGGVFIGQGVGTKQLIVDGLRSERVTLAIEESEALSSEIVDTMAEAQTAAETITQHLRERYGTYADTPRGSEERATYLDGLTLINSLNLAVVGFGMVTVVIVSGVLLVIMGLATGTIGVAMIELARRVD